jgi:hypothetical protein
MEKSGGRKSRATVPLTSRDIFNRIPLIKKKGERTTKNLKEESKKQL